MIDLKTPPDREVMWIVRRTNGKPFGGAFSKATLPGRTAWDVYERHLTRYGCFAEFRLEMAE